MSRPDDALLAQLNDIADELREVVAERGHRIDVALNVDQAFGSGQSRSWLTRDLVLDAIDEAASRLGIEFGTVNGSGRELRTFSDGVERRFRCRRASLDSEGNFKVVASSDAPLVVEDDSGLIPLEAWVFSWVSESSTELADVFVAKILGFTEGSPGHLELGAPILLLGGGLPGGGGFRPTTEGLEGFDDDGDLGHEAGTA
jgi:hypothetical protein